ncbi:MAG: hypothetical protein EOO62_22065 [Hymenobacter sp.]|nr:MAG: hypothetical protein EOO62_22065 [Hymenobacter sp.]
MNFRDFLKRIFSHQAPPPATLPEIPVRRLMPAVNHGELYITSHLVDIEIEAVDFIQRFGPDFNAFLYQPDVANLIRQQVLSPGPFYTGNSDTCDTGPYEAPNNVLRDSHAMEFVFRQPQNFIEFLCTLDATAVEVLDSYSCDGNEHWTYLACQEWWRGQAEIIRRLSTPAFQETNGPRTQLYIDYLNGAAETDLRKYCYFLENGHYPIGGETLPPL